MAKNHPVYVVFRSFVVGKRASYYIITITVYTFRDLLYLRNNIFKCVYILEDVFRSTRIVLRGVFFISFKNNKHIKKNNSPCTRISIYTTPCLCIVPNYHKT